jgi:hypothetical protein
MLAVDRDLLRAAGGFDPAMSDGAGLDCVDLWLRCRLLGAQALAWTEPPRAPAPPGRTAFLTRTPLHPDAAMGALAAFRDRWRPPLTEPAHA